MAKERETILPVVSVLYSYQIVRDAKNYEVTTEPVRTETFKLYANSDDMDYSPMTRLWKMNSST